MRHEGYADIKQAVEAAGFWTCNPPMESGGDRLCCAALKLEDGRGLGGNSFWVAERGGAWFLGTWAGSLYRVPDARNVADLCVALLSDQPRNTMSRPPEEIRYRFALREATEEESRIV